jgi:outer membrane protein TolC
VLSPAVSVPVFQGGRLTAQLKLARAESITAALAYRAAVLGALQEVENALVAYQSDRQRRERTAATLRSAQESLTLNRASYRAGLVPFLQVLLSENAEISARQALIQADLTLSLDIVTLYQALGGGWQQGRIAMADPPALAPIPPTPAALDAAAARLLRARPEVTPSGCGPASPC